MTAPPETPAGARLGRHGIQAAAIGALVLARLLVVARVLSPEQFGVFAIATTALALATSLAGLGGPTASDPDAAWTLGLARGAVLAGLVALLAAPVAALFDQPRATPVLHALALWPLVQALAPHGARRSLAEPAANLAIAAALAPFIGIWALVAGALGGASAGVAAAWADAQRRPRLVFDAARLRPALALAGWVAAAGAFAAAADFLLHVAVARRLGTAPLGVFALALGIALVPIQAAAEAFRPVGYALYARLVADAPALRRAFRALATALALTLVPLAAVLAVSARGLVTGLLDPRWELAVPALQLLAAAGALGLLAEAAVPLLAGVGLPRLVGALGVVPLATVAILVDPLTGALGITGAAVAWLAATGASFLVSWALLRKLMGPAPDQRHRIGAIVGSSVVGAAATLAVTVMLHGLTGLMVGVAAGLAAAWGVVRQADRWWRLDIGADLTAIRGKP